MTWLLGGEDLGRLPDQADTILKVKIHCWVSFEMGRSLTLLEEHELAKPYRRTITCKNRQHWPLNTAQCTDAGLRVSPV